jgi:hypothetical protein
MTPPDLSQSGWVYRLGRPGGFAIAGGIRMPVDAIRGVLTRLPFVVPADIAHLIAAEDRDYAAAEMTAFLAAWLQSLGDRALNPPSPTFLPGEAQTPARLITYAQTASLSAATETCHDTYSVSCVDGHPVGATNPAHSIGGKVARTMSDRLVRLHFVQQDHAMSLSGYDPFVDIGDPLVARAVLGVCR